MKIGVISDTHGHEMRFAKAVEKFFSDADLILHAGDVLYHGPRNPMLEDYNPAKLAQRINESKIPIIIARGNCDSDVDQNVINVPIQAPFAYIYAMNKRIVVTHGTHFTYCNNPELPAWKKMIDEIANQANHLNADIFITGHIHNNILERHNNSILLNPGSPALPNRSDKRPTVALISDNKIEIFDLDDGNVLMDMDI
ncbi:MAG: phosphodiesterase [Selenomonadaceae bacterium]|nr:phosphodiesterase [Selenomonadaceae bacterium]